MVYKKNGFTSEWKPISELRSVDRDMSDFGYKKEYIEEHNLEETKIPHWTNTITGMVNYFEPLEVKCEGNSVYYRVNENHVHMDEPELFDTQFGRFNNHNHGEFDSWLGRDDYTGLSERERETKRLFGIFDYYIKGNFCDMFDCGDYSYAISNLMHLGLGDFKIVRIDGNLEAITLYNNSHEEGLTCFEYMGRFENEQGYVVIVSGSTGPISGHPGIPYRKRTLLFQIDNCGNCTKVNEWNYRISSANSMVAVGNLVFFGQNKMVTCLNSGNGEITFYTNKSDDELDALEEFKW